MLHPIPEKESLPQTRESQLRASMSDRNAKLVRVLHSQGALELAWREQFFAWGCDVLHGDGDLLIRYGMNKIPRNLETRPFPEYVWDQLVDCNPHGEEHLCPHCVHLWAFGLYTEIESIGGLYYSRASLRPWFTETPLESIPASHEEWDEYLRENTHARLSARCQEEKITLLRRNLFAWIARYEKWILSQEGPHYRNACVANLRESPLPGSDLQSLWALAGSTMRRHQSDAAQT